MRLYVGPGIAIVQEGASTNNYLTAFTVLADSQDAAYGIAMRALKEKFPDSKGYTHHWVQVSEMPFEDVRAWLKAIEGAE